MRNERVFYLVVSRRRLLYGGIVLERAVYLLYRAPGTQSAGDAGPTQIALGILTARRSTRSTLKGSKQ